MEQITARVLRTVEWRAVYTYEGRGYGFTTYASGRLPGLTITKEKRGRRIATIYKFKGKRTDSPTQAVRYWNEEVKKQIDGGRPAPGSAEQVRRSRRDAGV